MPRPPRLTSKLLVRVVLCAAFLAPLRPFLQHCITRQKNQSKHLKLCGKRYEKLSSDKCVTFTNGGKCIGSI
ncbi:uncharacterized protein HD556DRAFT_1404498 [Suillus plorans]|uniref:Secreted protein n=1 Tax=Suillus plorans TaxID=116603 RepID=A0A9P7DCA1_9AGAM|nr:uncharacterized protein HD556DRAFT_1404498 [Suillus plorans]KAG1788205.1 hypothetical protein HD556DRAFT_1404498 [Suillus plorans]